MFSSPLFRFTKMHSFHWAWEEGVKLIEEQQGDEDDSKLTKANVMEYLHRLMPHTWTSLNIYILFLVPTSANSWQYYCCFPARCCEIYHSVIYLTVVVYDGDNDMIIHTWMINTKSKITILLKSDQVWCDENLSAMLIVIFSMLWWIVIMSGLLSTSYENYIVLLSTSDDNDSFIVNQWW